VKCPKRHTIWDGGSIIATNSHEKEL